MCLLLNLFLSISLSLFLFLSLSLSPSLSPTVFSSGNGQVQITGKLIVHSIASSSSLSSASINVLKEGITTISDHSQYVNIPETTPLPSSSTAALSSFLISPFSSSATLIRSSNSLRFHTAATAQTSVDSSSFEIEFLCVYLLSSYPSYNENPSLLAILKTASINFAVQSGSFQSIIRQLSHHYSAIELYDLTTTNHELILNTTIVPSSSPPPPPPSDDPSTTTSSSSEETIILSQGKVAGIVIGGVIAMGLLIGMMYYLITRYCCYDSSSKQGERRNPVLQQLGRGAAAVAGGAGGAVGTGVRSEAKRDSDDEEDHDESIIIEVA
jgi:hypothetical protein